MGLTLDVQPEIVTYGDPAGVTPAHLCAGITGFDAIGPGQLVKFSVNGKIIRERVVYFRRCVLERGVGLFADGELIGNIERGDTWRIETMINVGPLTNYIDRQAAYNFWSAQNPGRPINEMPLA